MKRRATPKKTLNLATKRLRALLRSPKTKAGLVAAVADLGLSSYFVGGWLSREVRADRVMPVQHRTEADYYVLCSAPPPDEKPKETIYPRWLEPNSVPRYAARRLCANLDPSVTQEEQEESEQPHGKKGTGTADS